MKFVSVLVWSSGILGLQWESSRNRWRSVKSSLYLQGQLPYVFWHHIKSGWYCELLSILFLFPLSSFPFHISFVFHAWRCLPYQCWPCIQSLFGYFCSLQVMHTFSIILPVPCQWHDDYLPCAEHDNHLLCAEHDDSSPMHRAWWPSSTHQAQWSLFHTLSVMTLFHALSVMTSLLCIEHDDALHIMV